MTAVRPAEGRRTWLFAGVALGLVVLLAVAVGTFAGYRFLAAKHPYAQPDRLCDRVDPGPLSALSLREEATIGRTTETHVVGGEPEITCRLYLRDARPDGDTAGTGQVDLRVTAIVYPDAGRAVRTYQDQHPCLARPDEPAQAVAGLGQRGCLTTEVVTLSTASTQWQAFGYTLDVQDRTLGLTVALGDLREPAPDRAVVRSAVVDVARHVMSGLAARSVRP